MAGAGLQHLVVEPYNGLCNRIRVIACAKRFHELTAVPCTLVWDWPDFEALFEPEPALQIVGRLPEFAAGTYLHLNRRGVRGGPEHLQIPLAGPSSAVITTCHSFGRPQDARYLDMRELGPWLPRPSARIREKARAFREARFPSGGIVGFHIRRTDSERPYIDSPDWRFIRQAKSIIAAGQRIYLATDNRRTERQMRHRFADNILIYPKNPAIARRWPREPDLEEISDDFADLLLLAACDYVLGSSRSSYSSLAMALNASPRCAEIEKLPVGKLSAADRWQALCDRLSAIPAHARLLRRRYEPRIGIGRAIRRAARALRS
jgi:hypothetical protein